jgi:PKD repeat protein
LAVVGATLHAAVALAVPVADFNWTPTVSLTHQQLEFADATASPVPIVSWQWDLDGDDAYDDATGATASWAFTRPGAHNVGLLVTDSLGAPDTKHHTVVIGNRTPVPSVVALPTAPAAGQQVTLLSNSYDSDGFIAAFAWDVNNDGKFDDGNGSSVSTTFPAGRHSIGLKVTDDSGDSASTAEFVDVGGGGGPVSTSGEPLLSPFPVVRVSGLVRKRGIKVRLLAVTGPVGATVHVRCRGRGCPFKRTSAVVRSAARKSATTPSGSGALRVRRFRNRFLRAGATVSIFVVKEGAIGKYTRLRIRKGKPPARVDRCVTSVKSRPFPCP